MKRRFLCLLLLFAVAATSFAQINLSNTRKRQQNNDQRALEEKIANNFLKNQEYDKAKDAYRNLYDKYKQLYHFGIYVDCLIQLKEYGEAEKTLSGFIESYPNRWKEKADLIFVYSIEGKDKKAEKAFQALLSQLPVQRSQIITIQNAFMARSMYSQALAVLEKGADINTDRYPFFAERAIICRAMADYAKAFELLFLDLKANPNLFESTKNRLQAMLYYDVNHSIADELRMALLKKAQDNPDDTLMAQLLVWFALQEEDYDIALAQSISIDRRKGDQDPKILNLSNICLNNMQFDVAKEGFEYVENKGKNNPFYGEAVTGRIEAEYQKIKAENVLSTKPYENLSSNIKKAMDAVSGGNTNRLGMIQAELLAYHLNQPDEAASMLNTMLEQSKSKLEQAQLKLELADILLYQDKVWDATLLYSQVDKSMKEEPLGHEARFKNAQLRYFIGEFAWAESQLHILKAATSKLIANDAMTLSLIIKDNLEADTTGAELRRLARADYHLYQHKDDEAAAMLDSIIANGNTVSIPHALFRQANIEEHKHQLDVADSLYAVIFNRYPESYMADDALMKAADINQSMGNKEQAMLYYEQLIDNWPTSIYTAEARKNYRKLQ